MSIPNEVPELPEANIGRYAFELAISEPAALVLDIAVPHNEDSIDSSKTVAKRVSFGSIAERNELAAAYFLESTLAPQNSDLTSILEQVLDIFSREVQCQDRVSVRICLGMNDRTDVLAALAASVTRTNVFKLLRLAGELVRELPSVNADSLIDLIGAQNRFTANDAASGLFFSDLTRILEQRLDLAESLLVAIRRRIDSGNASVYLIAFHALLKSDRAHQAALSISSDLVSEDVILRTAALQTVGAVLNAVESTDVAEICFRAIEANIASDDPAIRTSVFRAVAESLGRTQQFHSALYALVSSGSNEAVVVFARADPRRNDSNVPQPRQNSALISNRSFPR